MNALGMAIALVGMVAYTHYKRTPSPASLSPTSSYLPPLSPLPAAFVDTVQQANGSGGDRDANLTIRVFSLVTGTAAEAAPVPTLKLVVPPSRS